MSTLVGPQGYPDWVRVTQAVLSPIVSFATQSISSTVIKSGLYVGDAGCLAVALVTNGNANPVQVDFLFTDDQANTKVTGAAELICAEAVEVNDTVPCSGNFLEVIIGGSPGATIGGTISPLSGHIPGQAWCSTTLLCVGVTTTIASSATGEFDAVAACSGKAQCTVSADANTWTAEIQCWSRSQTAWKVIGCLAPTVGNDGQTIVYLPRSPARVMVTNTGGSTIHAAATLVLAAA